MLETPDDLTRLQQVMDASIENAGAFVRSSFQIPYKSLTASELVERLSGLVNVALATATAAGEPRVAPVGSVIVHGRFQIPTLETSLRVRHLKRDPGVSLTAFNEGDFAVIVHGRGELVTRDQSGYEEIENCYRQVTGIDVETWGDTPVFITVEPIRILTFDRHR